MLKTWAPAFRRGSKRRHQRRLASPRLGASLCFRHQRPTHRAHSRVGLRRLRNRRVRLAVAGRRACCQDDVGRAAPAHEPGRIGARPHLASHHPERLAAPGIGLSICLARFVDCFPPANATWSSSEYVAAGYRHPDLAAGRWWAARHRRLDRGASAGDARTSGDFRAGGSRCDSCARTVRCRRHQRLRRTRPDQIWGCWACAGERRFAIVIVGLRMRPWLEQAVCATSKFDPSRPPLDDPKQQMREVSPITRPTAPKCAALVSLSAKWT